MIWRHPKAPFVFGVLMILALAIYVTLTRSSPGELSKPHAAVAGSSFIADCKKCHAEKDVTAGCLGCHAEIQSQFDRRTGFHPFLLQGKTIECARCHSEHNGADFALVSEASWDGKDRKAFKHPHVDYRLRGAHAALDCEKCHRSKTRPPFRLPAFPKRVRENTYLGLSQTCIACHADPHAGGRASACASCHNQDHWKPAPSFNHDKFFPLKGPHARVSCNQCHAINRPPASPGNPLKIFGPVQGVRCVDCHANPHRVDWRQRCESCHRGDQPWSSAGARFAKESHALTGFRLAAPHAKTSCRKCHVPGRSFAQRYPAPRRSQNRCESCHPDAHRGQFAAKHPHCADCHGLRAFAPAMFGAADHRSYPLLGAHAAATCRSCHARDKQTGTRRFVGVPRDCAACHRDIHYGQFRSNGATRCENCHRSTQSWKRIVFNHQKQSVFKLDKAHVNISCETCHPIVVLKNGIRLVQYKPIRSQCKDCHDFEGP